MDTETIPSAPEKFSLTLAKDAMAGKGFREVIGRRKTATARVRVSLNKKLSVTVNGKDIAEYFKIPLYLKAALAPLTALDIKEGVSFTAVVNGGGMSAQAEAVSHGISRALAFLDVASRSTLKPAGLLKRDPRKKERKKPGLKKARKSSQWSKR